MRRPITPLSQFTADQQLIAPSLLAADFSDLGQQVRNVEAAGAEILHIDVMDGHFVPNLSIGPPVVEAIRGEAALPFDVHLMLTNPARYVAPFVDAGADHITIHTECDDDVAAAIEQIHEHGCSAGISIKPGTEPDALLNYIDNVELILVMTVEPGFGGQAFREDMIPRLEIIRGWIDERPRSLHLQVDGGIDSTTGRAVAAAGANVLVAGTSVFRHPEGVRAGLDAIRAAVIG